MKTRKMSFFGKKLAVLFFSGSLLIAGCCNTGKKEESCSAESECKSKKEWIDPATVNLFMEFEQTPPIRVNDHIVRRLTYLNDLMIVIVDFEGGPQTEPDPIHYHVHEQVSYVAEGEVLVIIGDQQKTLKAGDVFIVPSNVPHTTQMLTPTLRLIDAFNPIREEFLP